MHPLTKSIKACVNPFLVYKELSSDVGLLCMSEQELLQFI